MKKYILSQRESRTDHAKALTSAASGLFIRLVLLLAAALILSMTTNAQKHFNNVDANGVILDGYDAVAFFTDNKPVKGEIVIVVEVGDPKVIPLGLLSVSVTVSFPST